MTRAQRAAEVAALAAVGLNGLEIAERLGISRSYAYELLTDPSGAATRVRKSRYDLVCVDCGGRVDGTSPNSLIDPDEPVCRGCAGIHYSTWTREAIVLCIQEWADENGGIPPSANRWQVAAVRGEAVPSVTQVIYRFGTWNQAIIAAGFEPHPTGPIGGIRALTADERVECARRYAAGESTTQIAADIGCAPNIVAKWARRAGVEMRPAFGGRAA